MKASLCATLVVVGMVFSWTPLHAQREADEAGQGPQILTSDLARRQTVEKETFSASFLFVDEQPIVDIRINGDPQKFTQDTSVIVSRQFDNRKEQQVIEVTATNVSGMTRQKSFLVVNPTAVRRFGETIPKYYRIEDRWDTKLPLLQNARAGGVALAIGRTVYLIGGYSQTRYDYDVNEASSKDTTTYVQPVERFDAESNRTETLTGDTPKFTTHVSGAALNQKLYIFESRFSGQEFDPATNQWRKFESPIRINRVGPAAAVNNRIYLFGGLFGVQVTGQSARVNASLQVWEFNPSTSTFAAKRALPTARGGAAACVVKGIVYVFGGYDGDKYLDTAESYNPSADSWSKVTPMPTPRAFSACVVVNDLIYVIGGRNKGFMGERSVGVMEMFDPATGIWRDRKAVPTSRADPVAVAIEGVIYVMGGTDGAKPLIVMEGYR